MPPRGLHQDGNRQRGGEGRWDAGNCLSPTRPSPATGPPEGRRQLPEDPDGRRRSAGGYEMVPFDTTAKPREARAVHEPRRPDVHAHPPGRQAVRHRRGLRDLPHLDALQNALQVIDFVRGWNVTTTTGRLRSGPRVADDLPRRRGAQPLGGERPMSDKRTTPVFWKLGDIFHSSPVVVKPPVIGVRLRHRIRQPVRRDHPQPGLLRRPTPDKQPADPDDYTGVQGERAGRRLRGLALRHPRSAARPAGRRQRRHAPRLRRRHPRSPARRPIRHVQPGVQQRDRRGALGLRPAGHAAPAQGHAADRTSTWWTGTPWSATSGWTSNGDRREAEGASSTPWPSSPSAPVVRQYTGLDVTDIRTRRCSGPSRRPARRMPSTWASRGPTSPAPAPSGR